MKPERKSVFVTVGSTKFDAMIAVICDHVTLAQLKSMGFSDVTIQAGRSELPTSFVSQEDAEGILKGHEVCFEFEGLRIRIFSYRPSISAEMEKASLVISHAGAGSSLEALTLKKKLVTVVNDKLMDSHQSELADQFSRMRYSVTCKPESLVKTLEGLDEIEFNEYIPGNPKKFVDYMNSRFVEK